MILWAIHIAVFVWVFVEIIAQEGAPFGWWRVLVTRAVGELWAKPLATCIYCMSGQVALWSYFFIHEGYCFLTHVLFITFTMLTVKIIDVICYGRS